jgi:hypothetical protein
MADPKHKYKVAKLLIEHQQIIVFSQIVDFIPKSVIAKELHTSPTRFTRLLIEPFNFKLSELDVIAKRIKIPLEKIIELVILQEKSKYFSKKTNIKKKKK